MENSRFLEKLKIDLPYDPAIPLLSIYQHKTIIYKDRGGICCHPDGKAPCLLQSPFPEEVPLNAKGSQSLLVPCIQTSCPDGAAGMRSSLGRVFHPLAKLLLSVAIAVLLNLKII